MANSQGNKDTKKSTQTASKSTGTKSSSAKSKTSKKNKIRKPSANSYIIAALFAVLGVILLIGLIKPEGVLVNTVCSCFKGIFGMGFYVMPFALIGAGLVLMFSKRKTAVLRSICIILLPVFIGSVFHLARIAEAGQYKTLSELWASGILTESGGVVSGAISSTLVHLLGIFGAWVILTIFAFVSLLISLNIPLLFVNSIKSPKEKEKAKKERAEQREEFIEDLKTEIVYGEPKEEQPKKKETAADISRRIDIPLDDTAPKQKKKKILPKLFTNKPNVITPHDYVANEKGIPTDVPEADINKAVNDNPVDGFPNDEDILLPIDSKADFKKEVEQINDTAKPSKKTPDTSVEDIAQEIEQTYTEEKDDEYVFPPISLLTAPTFTRSVEGGSEITINKQRLEGALHSFGINADISNIVRGPSVTRYEMELEVGVKLNKLTSLSEDIALALGVANVRIAAIPDKVRTVGIEVPNKSVNTVYLRELIDSEEFKKSNSKLSFSIGKDISGGAIIGNIAKLPHLLVAGTTGSGKSVCLNSLILSILYKARPDEVKFIMVDPKMVEFNVYNGIPHLLVPVVTEAKKASGALQWAVVEMMKRYRLFSESGARDISSYNDLANLSDTDDIKPMPQIVVIIDELADLMMVAAKEVEESVCRIAQMGRAAGIHLVIATQSPRADVITGLMKANIPSRISFKVASALESRIILDAGGNADKLMGNGDLLYAPVGTSRPTRIQGAWVTDEERENIVNFVKNNGNAHYSEAIINEINRAAEDKKTAPAASSDPEGTVEDEDDTDPLYAQAVEIVLDGNQASVSMLQRRLKLGYSRAARLVDQMEEHGIVGPFEGSKPRQVLITKQQWQEMQLIHGTAPVAQKGDIYMTSADDLFEDEE